MALAAVMEWPPELSVRVYGPPDEALNCRLNFPSAPAVALDCCGSPLSVTDAPDAATPVIRAPGPPSSEVWRTTPSAKSAVALRAVAARPAASNNTDSSIISGPGFAGAPPFPPKKSSQFQFF